MPHTHVGRTLTVSASATTVRILEGLEVVASHARSFDRGLQIEDPAHVEALVAHKHASREHRSLDRLHHAVPASRQLLRVVAERGGNLGSMVFSLTGLLDAVAAHAGWWSSDPPI